MKLNEYMLTSLQCGRQIAQLKDEYEEAKKTLEEETLKLRQVSLINLNKKDKSYSCVSLVNDEKFCLHIAFIHYFWIFNTDVFKIEMNCPVFLFSKLSCSLNSFVFSVICFPFQSAVDGHKNVVGGRHADTEPGVETAGERHTVATHRHDRHSDLKGRVIKLSNAAIVYFMLLSTC